ncbi:MAG: hypothetical protein EA362_11005 [Saprospirales bacterium]|nr:MAG: hypothetical protein EA362_11005 [Saprospirales bacterium]
MFIQCSTEKCNGKDSRKRKLAESYRDPVNKQSRVCTVQKIETLPIAERAKIIYEHLGKKHLTSDEWNVLNDLGLLSKATNIDFEVGDIYKGAGSFVALEHLNKSGFFRVLDK